MAGLAPGFHDVPPGHLATVVTHLEMRQPVLRPCPTPECATLRHVARPELDWYRDLFLRVGGQDWLWSSRLLLDSQELSEVLDNPDCEVYGLEVEDRTEGFLELDFREPKACEIAFFGVAKSLTGTTAGRFLMNKAISRAFERPIARLHVHTCTLDHPSALAFYLRSGFSAVRQQVEIMPDPRLNGVLPADAAPQVPIYQA